MKSQSANLTVGTLLLASRPAFLTASISPVLVGTAMGFADGGSFQPVYFVLAMIAIMLLHAGANLANDYFDHISQNDWLNRNPTPFSGGSRYIQNGILSPQVILVTAVVFLAAGSLTGVAIVVISRSVFILLVGIAGLLGGFFYTAPPVKLGYRCLGEIAIVLLFGLLPVYGAYYLQTASVDVMLLPAGCIVGVLIFLVILVNEFADLEADSAVGKNTLVVLVGVRRCVWIYRIVLTVGYVLAAAMLLNRRMFFAGLFFLFTAPVAVAAVRAANAKHLTTAGSCRAARITILLHALGTIALTAGFIVSAVLETDIR